MAAPSASPAGEPATATYTRDVAPIFRKNCEKCHRPGEVAPMSLLGYQEIRPWARSIRKEVSARRMPPWHADPACGKFLNDPTLAQKDIDTIISWIDAGALEGNPADLPPPQNWTDGWQIGEPDAVFELPEAVTVPASGTIPYKYFTVPTNFTEDRWIARAEARPGSRAVVHHILVFAVQKDGLRRRRDAGNMWENYLAGMAPGSDPAIFPAGKGKKVKAGSILLFQVHYTANGKEQTDRSKFGVVFAKEPPREEIYTRALMNPNFRIPPNAEDHVVESWSKAYQSEVTLLSLMPHMHLRGKSFEYRLVDPEGKETPILSVPRYDFNWQHSYVLAEPLVVKPGWRLHCIAHYDNSKNNPGNPDPNSTVRWGDQTWEEMMIGFTNFSRPVEAGSGRKEAPKVSADVEKKKLRQF
ncbi:MAG: thiol-disulfide isomerase [Planctomycetes bacterium]|nr:thiol-disulfide isomerase [Planctomycetota bacterium]